MTSPLPASTPRAACPAAPRRAVRRTAFALTLALIAGTGSALSCAPPRPSRGAESIAAVERLYLSTRDLRDALDIAAELGASRTDGPPVDSLEHAYRDAWLRLRTAVDRAVASSEDDVRALGIIRRSLGGALPAPAARTSTPGARRDTLTASVPCGYEPAEIAEGEGGGDRLAARIYECYGRAATQVAVGRDTLDRLTVLGMLGREPDASRRRELFLSLAPVWRSVNGDGDIRSPYRTLLPLTAEGWRRDGSPVDRGARELGIDPARLEGWLEALLERWRESSPADSLEPWDWWYAGGAASRRLAARIPLDSLAPVNRRVFAALGADPAALGVRYDLAPRPGKTPVAYCTFERRGRMDGGRWSPTIARVFATYRVGGLDNLNELLHETGHAVHISAIRARPAFADWPDADPLSEGLGDLVALEAYEPEWQMRFLGDSATTAENLRARYSGVIMDVAWTLFEMRVHRDPSLDPNRVWTEITSRWLRIRPHPELSWWAMRGQLVSDPGYMSNYAIGAILVADLRARIAAERGPMWRDGADWYPWVSERLYRFGLARPSREVVEELLGRPISPEAIMRDVGRLRGAR